MSASLRHARSIALRTSMGLAALTATVGAVAVGEGCGPGAPKTDNLCGWLGAEENCYRTFAEDIGDRCGSTDENQRKGSFGKREALDICILKGGGQAIFDPPLDPTKLPPEKVGFKLLDLTGAECGSGSWELAGQDVNDDEISYTFSITVKGDDLGGGGAGGGGGGGAGGSGGLDPSIVVGGTYTSVVAEGGDFFDATCADGEAFKFNLLSIDRCDASQELSEDYSKLIPRARLVWSSGGVDVPGRLRFSVLYPPLAPADLNGASPTEMVYFDCDIPPAPKPCFNGAQDGGETDVDCGGSSTIFDACQYDCQRCGDGAKCGSDCDCDPATVCDFVMGFKKCIADPMAMPPGHTTNTCDVDLSTTPECLAQGGSGGAGGSGTGGGGAGGTGGTGGAGGAGGGGAGGN